MTKPKPPAPAQPTATTIPATELAEISGYSPRHLRRVASDGYFQPPEHGAYKRFESLVGLIKYQRELLHQKTGSPKADADLRLKNVKIAQHEFDLEVARGKYIPLEEIGPALRNLSGNQRATLQRKLEIELPPRLVGKTAIEQMELLKGAVDDICRIFRESTGKWTMTPPPKPKGA